MDSARPSTGANPRHKRLSRHSSAFSLSFSFRSRAKKGSTIMSPEMPPACLESVHYPVFDPQDPRHNSQVRQLPRRPDPQTVSPVSLRRTLKTPNFPQRSLRKARSELLALTSSLFHRTSHQGSELLESETRSPKQRHVRRSTHGFSDISSSTQEDLSFGIDLYRTSRARPRTLDDPNVNVIGWVPSFYPLRNTIFAPQPTTSSCTLVHEPQPVFGQNVYTQASAPPSHQSYTNSAAKFNLPVDEEDCTDQKLVFMERSQKSRATLKHTVASENQHAAEPSSSSSTEIEDTSGTSLLCGKGNAALRHERSLLNASMDCEGPACKMIGELRKLSEARNAPSSDMMQNHSDSKESLHSLPDYSTPSLHGSEVYQRQRSTGINPEALITQESLLLEDDSLEPQPSGSPLSESSKGSAEVRIAFPGLYRELQEQWAREFEVMPQTGLSGRENERPSGAAHLPSFPTDTTPHHNPGNQPQPSTKSPWRVDFGLDSGPPNSCGDLQKEKALISQASPTQSRSVTVHCMQDSITLTDNMDDYTQQHETQPTRSREVQSNQRRHSFSIRISTRNESTSQPSSIQVSRRCGLQRSSEEEHNPFHDRHTFSPSNLWAAADSQYDDSDISTNFTRDTSAVSSANYTSPTSISSPPWSTMNSPIDEEALFRATHRDEYYMADGKHSSFYPDRGDLPVKGERLADNRRNYCNPDNIGPSSRLRLMTRVGASQNVRQSFQPEVQGREEHDEDEPTEGVTPGSQAPA